MCYVRVRPLLLLVDATIEVKLVKLTILNENAAFAAIYISFCNLTNNSSSRSLMQKNIRTKYSNKIFVSPLLPTKDL